jgi:hypothetical protein
MTLHMPRQGYLQTFRFKLRLTDWQHAQWRAAAKAKNCSLARWVFEQCEAAIPPPPRPARMEAQLDAEAAERLRLARAAKAAGVTLHWNARS